MNRRAVITLMVVAVLLMTPVSSAFAGFSRAGTPSVTTQSADVYDADLEAFRTQLMDYYTDLADAFTYVVNAGGDPSVLDGIAEARQAIAELSYDELTVLRSVIGENPDWWDLPNTLRSYFGPEAQTQGSAATGLLEGTGSLLSHSCPVGLPNGILDWFIARDVAQGIEFGLIFAPNDLVGGVIAAGFGVVATISAHPIKIALQVAYEAAQTAALVLEQIYFINDECEQNNHRAILHDIVGPRVDVAVSSRASQASLDSHNTNLNNHDANIDADLVAHDANIDADLVAHDANIDADLVAHDANLTNRADVIDASIAALEAKSDALEVKSDALADQVTQVQYTLDTEIEKMRVHLQVIEIKEKARYLLVSTEAGLPVDVTLIGLQVSDGSLNGPITFADVFANATVTPVKPGILDVAMDLTNAAPNAQVFEFMVEHSHGPDPSHFGTIVIHRTADNNLGAGQ